MYRIAVCDDESRMCETLQGYLDRWAGETGQNVQSVLFSSANDLLRDYPKDLDILFLDIQMAGVDGMAAARQIRTFDERVCIIFITTMHQYALEGYSVRAFGFVKKPVSYARFRHELTSAIHQVDSVRARDNYVTLRSGNAMERLPVSRLVYCEVRNHSVDVHLDGGEVRSYRCQMKELEEMLAPYGFFRCHAAFLVNSARIARIGAAQLDLNDGSAVPVSQHRRKDFLAALTRYMGERI